MPGFVEAGDGWGGCMGMRSHCRVPGMLRCTVQLSLFAPFWSSEDVPTYVHKVMYQRMVWR